MSVSARRKVLVTGASGFIAAWIARTLLQRGHHVRGTVRSVNKGEYLKNLFREHGNRFDYVLVEDIAKDGAFDEACKEMDAVVHTASPFHLNAIDPEEIIFPAVRGTTGILESVLKFAPTVKRVVITSSTITMLSDFAPVYNTLEAKILTERDWNEVSVRAVNEMGKSAPQVHKYGASKVLAEKAAWDFLEKHKAEVGWDLVTLQPPFVFGPVIHEISTASALNTSNAEFLALLQNRPTRFVATLAESAGSYVDVRDVAWAHAEAISNNAIAGKSKNRALYDGEGRVVLSAGEFTWQGVLDVISVSPSTLPKCTQRGEENAGKNVVHLHHMDSRHARNALGMEFRTLENTFVDTLESFRRKGWVE